MSILVQRKCSDQVFTFHQCANKTLTRSGATPLRIGQWGSQTPHKGSIFKNPQTHMVSLTRLNLLTQTQIPGAAEEQLGGSCTFREIEKLFVIN